MRVRGRETDTVVSFVVCVVLREREKEKENSGAVNCGGVGSKKVRPPTSLKLSIGR